VLTEVKVYDNSADAVLHLRRQARARKKLSL
jgi:hypothetical protein